ncbi:MAG: glycosyltransferase [Candidatus Limnocylindrales bacterium]
MPPLRVLVIARWYPAVDDPVRGSFVADQVDSLVATGQAAPQVVSFEFVRLNRVVDRREPERDAIHARYGVAVRERADRTTPGGWPAFVGTWPHLLDVPVARLPVASGPEDPPVRESEDHRAALMPLIEDLARRGERYDLVHAHTGFPDGDLARQAAEMLGIPFVVTEHSSQTGAVLRDPAARELYAAAVRGSARVMVVSESLGAALRAGLPELADRLDEKLEVVPNSVPVELFRAPPLAERRPGELLYVGTRKADKGIGTLLEAFALARAERPELTLRLIGRAPTLDDENAWLARAESLGIAGAVRFDPPADRAGVAAAMARADLFVHASRRETFGVVLAEALASGLPVVATRSGGAEGILGHDPSAVGALVPVDNPPAMAAAILETLARRGTFDPERLRAGAAARFGAAVIARRLLEIYRSAVAAGESTARGPAAGEAATATAVGAAPPGGTGRAGDDGAAIPGGGERAGTARAGDWAAAPLPIVVGFNRVQAGRLLAALPGELLARLTLVTGQDPGDQPLPKGIGAVAVADLDAGYEAALRAARPAQPPPRLLGRIIRYARDPGATDRIAAVHAARPRYRLETAQRWVIEAARAARANGPGASLAEGNPAALPDLLCIDGYDVLAAGPALDSGAARLAPGGIRWLADRWATAQVRTARDP